MAKKEVFCKYHFTLKFFQLVPVSVLPAHAVLVATAALINDDDSPWK